MVSVESVEGWLLAMVPCRTGGCWRWSAPSKWSAKGVNFLSSGLRTTSRLDLRGRLPREPAGFTFVDYSVFEVHRLLPGDLMRWLMGMVHMDMDETIDGIHKIKNKK